MTIVQANQRTLPMNQPNPNYTCKVFTDQADHRLLERFYRDYKPNDVSSLPAFILGMDRLVSDFRSRYNPDSLEDGDVENLEEEGLDNAPDDLDDEDDSLPNDLSDNFDDLDGDDGEGDPDFDPVDPEGDEETAAYRSVANQRFGRTTPTNRIFQVQGVQGLDSESEKVLRSIFTEFHINATTVSTDTKENAILVGTTVTNMTAGKIKAIEASFQKVYPNMETLKVGIIKGRIAFKLHL